MFGSRRSGPRPGGLPQLLALAPALAACGTAGPSTTEVVPPQVAVRAALPPGTVVRLLPAERTADGDAPLLALDGWFREAMRQTTTFDIAAGPDDVSQLPDRPIREVALHCDPTARVLTTTLRPAEDGATMPLASASFRETSMPSAIDALAAGTRLALGEPGVAGTLPVALAYSPDPRAVERTEQGLGLLADGRLGEALRTLQTARRLDGGSPTVLDALAAVHSLLGDNEAARAIAEEGLALRDRLAPTALHRLGRTLQLARATLNQAAAAARDQELLALAEASLRERPFDLQGRYSKALALSFLGRFADSRPLWAELDRRLPGNAITRYHLGWAELATGRPAAAAEALARAAPTLPRAALVMPRAIALYEQGDHEALARFLDEMLTDPDLADGASGHELRRIQAAHALLTQRNDAAARLMLEQLEWLRQRPSLLQHRGGELRETGEVLVRLGRADELGVRIEAMADLGIGGADLQDALAFLAGLVQVARTGERARAAEASLLRNGRLDAWGYVLQAIGHRARGELLDEYTALAQAARLNDSPLVKAALVRSLRAMGRGAEADALRDAMRREMKELHLRRRLRHPLLGPELALAFLAS